MKNHVIVNSKCVEDISHQEAKDLGWGRPLKHNTHTHTHMQGVNAGTKPSAIFN